MTAWIDIGGLADIPRRGARRVVTPSGTVAVFRTQSDELYAVEDRCPHRRGPLSQGIVHDCAVTCPLHGWVIDLRTGRARGEDDGQVVAHDVRLDGERVLLRLRAVAPQAA